MRNALSVLVAVATLVAMAVAPAGAATVIDFGTGFAAPGGVVTLFDDGSLSGSNIPIGALTIVGAPTASANGVWEVTGGELDFATGGKAGSSSITIDGAVSGLGIQSQQLLFGTISSFVTSVNGLISGSGIDGKSPDLLAAVGLPANETFEFFGFSLTTFAIPATGGSSPAISTDVRNTAVPEPGSLLLLGSALGGVGIVARRFWSELR
jgi:hypothetical protein